MQLFRNQFASFAYGSQIAGYATKDSDIDMLVVLRRFPKKVKYVYEGKYSYLVVDKAVFEQDIRKAEYGDFIANRIHNPIKPLFNRKYVEAMEVELKSRVILDYALKLIYKYKENARNLRINILYFPFRRWKKICRVHPPFIYSIENTLRKDLRARNLRKILLGYRKAIKKLGILKHVKNDWYKINGKFINKHLTKIKRKKLRLALKEVETAYKKFKTHGKATKSSGMTSQNIIYEVLHKIKRAKRKKSKFKINPEKYIKIVK